MHYKIVIRQEAKRKLQSLPAKECQRLADKIMELGLDPDDPSLDIKPLVGSHFWCLYVLLPISVYNVLRDQIEEELSGLDIMSCQQDAYEPFDPADFVQNPIALARMKAGIKQVELARRMNVSQAYISKLEHSDTVSEQIMKRIQRVLQTKT